MKQNYGCITIAWIFWLIVACFYNIKPDYEYGWAWGLFWHGPLAIPNWIISFFDSGKYCMAPLHTSGYAFWWWVMLLLNAYAQITTVLFGIKYIFHRMK